MDAPTSTAQSPVHVPVRVGECRLKKTSFFVLTLNRIRPSSLYSGLIACPGPGRVWLAEVDTYSSSGGQSASPDFGVEHVETEINTS